METRSARWLALGLFFAISFVIALVVLGRADHAAQSADELREQPFMLADALLRAHQQIHVLQTGLHDIVRTGDAGAATVIPDRMSPQDVALREALNLVVSRHASDDSILVALVKAISAWRDNRAQVAELVATGRRAEAEKLFETESERLYRALHDTLESAQSAERQNAQRLRAEADEARRSVQHVMLALAVLASATLTATLCGLVLTFHTHRPLSRLRATLLALADGDTSVAIPYEGATTPVGALARAMACFRDSLTERDNALAALRRSDEQLRRAIDAKGRILAATNHDLRQPLQALRLYLDTLEHRLEGTPEQAVVASAQTALASGEELLRNYLDVSLLESGLIRPNLRKIAVAPLLRDLAGEFSAQAADKGLSIRMVPCTATIRSDPELLHRMLHNLLANALRYTTHGWVLLGCRRRGENLRIEVWDTGIGIAADHLGIVFEEFFQLNNPERDRAKGVGLGLSVVERAAHLLQHPLDVSSRPTQGSMFAVTVPLVPEGGA